MARPDQEKCRLCSKLDSQEAQQRHDRMGTAVGTRSIATIAVPTIVIGESGTIFASSDDGNSQPKLGYQKPELLYLNKLRP